jgi:hypothetical protein
MERRLWLPAPVAVLGGGGGGWFQQKSDTVPQLYYSMRTHETTSVWYQLSLMKYIFSAI